MKIVLEIDDKSYPTILDFISLFPENKCRVLADETATLNAQNTLENKQNLPLHKHKLLPSGARLLVALTIKSEPSISDDLKANLKSRNDKKYLLGNEYYHKGLSVDTQFVEVTIAEPTALQKSSKEIDEGGLFLLFKGLNQTGILTSSGNG